jgi:hypothetical protein
MLYLISINANPKGAPLLHLEVQGECEYAGESKRKLADIF